MPGLTVKIPNTHHVINNKKYLFWFFVALISVLVISIIGLIIKSQQPRDFASSPVSSYQAGCEDLTSAWHVGETGSSGTIKVIFRIFLGEILIYLILL